MYRIALPFCCIAIALLFSCTSQKKQSKQEYFSSFSPFGDAKYKPIKYSFFINEKNDIFEQKEYLIEDSTGFHRVTYYDSLIQTGKEWGDKTPLKDIIDIQTYTELGDEPYFSKDKNQVYFTRASSDGAIRLIIKDADSRTFSTLGNRWAKDKKHIYWGTEKVLQAHIKSFRVFGALQDSAMDKNHCYYHGEMVQ